MIEDRGPVRLSASDAGAVATWAIKTALVAGSELEPPHFDARIAAQNGAFLFGGIPRSQRGLRWPKQRGADARSWHLDDVRRCISRKQDTLLAQCIASAIHALDPLSLRAS
jgi:hypothetical protein